MAKELIGDLHLIEISVIITSSLIHFFVPAPSPGLVPNNFLAYHPHQRKKEFTHLDLLFQDSAGFLRSQVKENCIRAVFLLHNISQQNALNILKAPCQHPHGSEAFSSPGMRTD